MSDGFTIANFRHVAHGLQEGQFAVGDKRKGTSLDDLAPIYREVLDAPVTMTLAVTRPDGRASLTPMWFDHADNQVLVNTASHRNKCQWIRDNPRLTVLLVNPKNPYHWVQIKCTVRRELREWDAGGEYVTRQTDKIWTKYTGQPGPYGLRDPKIDENACCSSAASTASPPSGSHSRRGISGTPSVRPAPRRPPPGQNIEADHARADVV